jgi:mRNA interferase RelE/StbE
MKIEFSKKAEKDFKSLDKSMQERVSQLLIQIQKGPKEWINHGKRLKGNLSNFWSFRLGNYRLIGIQKDGQLVFIALRIAHRRLVYDSI